MSNERSPRGLCSMTMGTSGMCILSTTEWLSYDSNHMVVKGEGLHAGTARDRGRGHTRGGLGGADHRGGPRALARGRPRTRDPRRARRGAVAAGLVVVERRRARDARRVPGRGGARRHAGRSSPRPCRASRSRCSPRRSRRRSLDGDPGPVFAALADPTRRRMVETLLRDGSTSVPALTVRAADHPSGGRQAPRDAQRRRAGRARSGRGREVHYRLRHVPSSPPRSGCADGGCVGRAPAAPEAGGGTRERARRSSWAGVAQPLSASVRSSSARTIRRTVSTPGLPVERQSPQVGPAEQHRVGAERERLGDVGPAADAAVEQHGHVAPDRVDDRRQRIERARWRRRPGGRRGWRRSRRPSRARSQGARRPGCRIPFSTIGSDVSERRNARSSHVTTLLMTCAQRPTVGL